MQSTAKIVSNHGAVIECGGNFPFPPIFRREFRKFPQGSYDALSLDEWYLDPRSSAAAWGDGANRGPPTIANGSPERGALPPRSQPVQRPTHTAKVYFTGARWAAGLKRSLRAESWTVLGQAAGRKKSPKKARASQGGTLPIHRPASGLRDDLRAAMTFWSRGHQGDAILLVPFAKWVMVRLFFAAPAWARRECSSLNQQQTSAKQYKQQSGLSVFAGARASATREGQRTSITKK